jgi:HPt (histidine-containing phosphotransfer) domain-containing protein
MKLANQKISSDNSTINQLLMEFQEECQNVISLVNQLQLSELSDRQKGKILSELLVASIHLHSHCDEDWQNLISDELENLVDD